MSTSTWLHAFAATMVIACGVLDGCAASLAAATTTTTKAPTPAPPPTTPSPTPFPLPAPVWGTCSGALSSLYQSCATVYAPQHWAGAATNHANLTFFLGRVEPSNAVAPNTTVWYLGDDCTADGLTQWISSMLNLNFYIVSVYTRGSVYGNPSITCPGPMIDPQTGWPLPTCGPSLTAAGVDASVFSFTEMANDLKYVIPKLGSVVNVVFADGLMTTLAQRLQVIQPDVATTYVLSGFSAPDRYDAISSPLDAFETVARRILQQCIDTVPQCIGWFGGQDPWQVWAMTLEAAAAGVLPCTASLKWNVASYRDALANIAAMLISSAPDPFTQPAPAATQAFFPAMIYRLQRCNAADVSALTALYTKLNATSAVVPNANPQCATNTALWFNLIINELVQSVPTVEGVAASLKERKVQPSSQYYTAIAAVAASWPKYTVPAAEKVVGAATQPTALIAGDGDVFSPIELAQYAVSLYYTHAQFTTISRGQHPLLSTVARSCVISILSNVGTSRSTATVPACGGGAVAPYDYLGTSTTASILTEYLSIDDLWAYSVPMSQVNPIPLTPPAPTPPPATPSPATPTPAGASEPSSDEKKAVIALSLLLVFSWVGVGAFVWYKRGSGSCCKKDKDFYSALNDERQH